MSLQRSFSEAPMIVSASEPHMAFLFLVDVSGSMSGKAIKNLNSALEYFKEAVCQDEQSTQILDVAVVAFNHEVQVVQPFAPVQYMENIELKATGGTDISAGVEVALNMVDDRSRFYRENGTEPYKPWIFMISDGAGGDVSQVAQKVQEREAQGNLQFFSLGVAGYDSNTLHQLCGKKVYKLDGYDFRGMFDWAVKSVRAVSVSSPGERAMIPSAADTVSNVAVDADWF